MTADDDRMLDPDRVATRGFSMSFRGFDTEEVRRFLEELASALRAQREEVSAVNMRRPDVEKLSSERDGLARRILDLEGQIRRMEEEVRIEAEPQPVDATAQMEFDEATATELLGRETVRVLDTAREAAREIVSKAEASIAERTSELEERESTAATDIEERLKRAAEDAAEMRRAAKDEADQVTAEASSAALAITTAANEEAATTRKAGADEATEVRTRAKEEAVRVVAQAEAEAATTRAEAEEAATQLRSTAEADASASQDAAREQARQMLNEAQAVREKVLADLVKRRRVGRQQLDQVKAARDRLARSLAVVRKDLDEAMGEVVAAVPDARAAMEAVGRRIPESSDNRQAAELATELDNRSVGSLPGLPEEEEPEELPDIDELFARIKSGDDTDDAGPRVSDHEPPPEPKKSQKKKPVEKRPAADENGAENADEPPPTITELVPAGEKQDEPSGHEDQEREDPEVSEATAEPVVDDTVATAVGSQIDRADAGESSDPVVGADSDELDEDDSETGAPRVFLARDVALTRFGPDLRRKLKRALADDQSQILDGLRQVKGAPALSDLPAADSQVDSYTKVLAGGLTSAADAGAGHLGASVPPGLVDAMVEELARAIVDPLRSKVERVVSRADDRAEAIEPIRAHYREVRSTQLPDLVDDALADAFAAGLFDAIPEGSEVRWVADPRVEAGPDCYDNTLAGSLTKSEVFPTGHACPPGSPGCRCLVTPTD